MLRAEPEWTAVPHQVKKLLRICLEKDAKQRLRDIGDAWRLLEGETLAPASAVQSDIQRPAWLWPVSAAVLAATTLMLAFVHFREKPPTPERLRFQVPAPGKSGFNGVFNLSPDGRQLAYISIDSEGRSLLWVHSLDSGESRSLGNATGSPFWSPDSRFIGFEVSGTLRKVAASGGPAETVSEVPSGWGSGAWNRNDEIVIGSLGSGGLFRVSAAGGSPAPLTTLDRSRQEVSHGRPRFLPDGRHFLYLRSSSSVENSGIYVGSLDLTPEQQPATRLVGTQLGPVFATSPDQRDGYLLFAREGTLMAQPFDTRRLMLTGAAVTVTEQVGNQGSYGSFSASDSGTLAYRSGIGASSRLTWFDRQGQVLGTASDPLPNWELALSPDAQRVATRRTDATNDDIWLFQFARGARTRFTFDPAQDVAPVWSPDGRQIIFASTRSGAEDLYRKSASGGAEEELYKSGDRKFPQDWSRDGRFLLYAAIGSDLDLWVLPLEGERKPVPFLRTPFRETQGRFSPDGHWIAYASTESGKTEVYVRLFPMSSGGGEQWMVSTAGGSQPHWRRDGKELFYLSPDNMVMSADVSANTGKSVPSFQSGAPKALFSVPVSTGSGLIAISSNRWDVTADGQRFLVNASLTDMNPAPIAVVLNWAAALKP